MSQDIVFSDATRLAELIRTRQISPVEIMRAHLDRIAAVDPKVNAIVTVAQDALALAKEAEAAVMAGGALGPLHGVPFTVKDSIDTAGVLTQRGSPIFRGRPINVQLVGSWQAESTILHAAAVLEGVSPVRGLHVRL